MPARILCERDGFYLKAVQLWQSGEDHNQTAPTLLGGYHVYTSSHLDQRQ